MSPSIAICCGDFAPYIYRTDDFGRPGPSLTDGTNGIAADEPTRVVREDPDRAGLLYAGTEFGIYISFDNGAHWQSFQLNLPAHPSPISKSPTADLVLSTQGRSFLGSSITSLRIEPNQRPTAPMKPAIMSPPGTAIRTAGRGGRAAVITVSAARRADRLLPRQSRRRPMKMEILDGTGKVIRTFTPSANAAPEEPAAADSPPPMTPKAAMAAAEVAVAAAAP